MKTDIYAGIYRILATPDTFGQYTNINVGYDQNGVFARWLNANVTSRAQRPALILFRQKSKVISGILGTEAYVFI